MLGRRFRRPGWRAQVNGRGSVVRRSYAVIGVGAAVVYITDLGPVVNGAAFILLGVTTTAALLLGPWINDVPRGPWHLVAAASTLFAVGAGSRPLLHAQPGWQGTVPDLIVLPAYLVLLAGLGVLMHRRDGVRDVHATTDMLIVLLGASSVAVTLLALPASQVPGRPMWQAAASAAYPVLDMLVLAVLVQLWFTSTNASWSLASMVAGLSALLVGDFWYAWLGRQGVLVAPHGVDSLFAVAYLLLGFTALHPSMRALTVGHRRAVQAWTPPRVGVVAAALSAPAVLLATPSVPGSLRVALAVSTVVGTLLLLLRSTTAVRALGRLQRATLHEATHDPLTRLPNRVFVESWLVRNLARGRSVSLLFLDLDGFKLVNDSFGHSAGDELLAAVADRLRHVIPPTAVLGRLGGDEFVVALADDPRPPQDVAADVITVISTPFALTQAEVVVTASIGISVSDRSGHLTSSAQDLLQEADTAMYRAKAVGQGAMATFDDSMRASVRERLALEQSLRQALALDQLTVHFQPVADLISGDVVSHEALLRWAHPVRGNVPPDQFIDMAEDTGLIIDIGAWVIDRSLEAVARRRALGQPEATVAVNVAGRQLIDPTMTERVTCALARHGLPASALTLEITESAMLQDDVTVTRTLHELVRAGVTLSMDDFGTGFSSLSYLRRLPVREVKIDRSFVAGLVDSAADEAIIRAATAMAHALRLTVVAEGIETAAQRDKLALLGVDRGQGWYYGRPVAFAAAATVYADAGRVTAPSRSSITAAGATAGTGDS